MRFSPSDLAALAQMKAGGNQQPGPPTGYTYQPEPPPLPDETGFGPSDENLGFTGFNMPKTTGLTGGTSPFTGNHPLFDSTPTPLTETNGRDPGNVGQTLHMPTVPGSGLGFGHESPVMGNHPLFDSTPVEEPGRASVPGVSDYIMERVNNGAYNLNLASITHGDGATRDALVNAGYGDWVKGAYERAMDERAAHYGGNGSQNAMDTAQLGWYNDRYGTYGGQQAQTQPVGQPVPIAPQPRGNPGGMFSGLTGVTNVVRGINGQQQDPTSAATSRASNMFNGLAGVTNAVRGINGQQPPPPPPQQQQNQQTQPNKQQYQQPPTQESPNWGQNTNTMTAGSPPGHGGGNPGFSGMMNNTADTMAALKALAQRFRR